MRALIFDKDDDTGAMVCSDVVISSTDNNTVFTELAKYTVEGSPISASDIGYHGIAYRHASGEIRIVIGDIAV